MTDNFKDMLFKKANEQPKAEAPKPTAEFKIDPSNGDNVRMVDPVRGSIVSLENRVAELQNMISEMRENPAMPDMAPYLTTREQFKSLRDAVDRENIEITNKALITSMEQISIMREDFFKLCSGMRGKLDSMTAEDVLASFEAYQVDMENILTDAGVYIGHFEFDSLNTSHQRIVEIVPTNDMSKNGKIAERLSDGYKIGNRVLFKEKVSVYRYTELAEETISKEPAEEIIPELEPTEAKTEEAAPESEPEEKPKPKRKRKTTKTAEEAE